MTGRAEENRHRAGSVSTRSTLGTTGVGESTHGRIGGMSRPPVTRFRRHQAATAAAVVAVIAAVPLATAAWVLTPILLVPLAIAVWAWRSGTDASPTGITVRALAGHRTYRWSEIAELAAAPDGGAAAQLTDGRVVLLPAVRAADLPRLVAASGRTADDAPAGATADRPAPTGGPTPTDGPAPIGGPATDATAPAGGTATPAQ
jgi:hypothetical protein